MHAYSFEGKLTRFRLYLICQAVGWTLYGGYMLALLAYQQPHLGWRAVADVVFSTLGLLLVSHLYRLYIKRHQWARLLFGTLLLRIVLASFLLSFLAIPLGLLSSFLFGHGDFQFSLLDLLPPVVGGTLVFFCWSLGYFLYHYVSTYDRNLRWEAMVNEFELNRLRSQLNPHFLFNALNSVRALVDLDPERAKESIDQLSNLLRSSLLMDKKHVIDLAQELELVRDYLALEQTRFEERLQVQWELPVLQQDYKVPPMMLQTLVENAIKHGISKRMQGGTISIRLFEQDGRLCCQLRNCGSYRPQERDGGYGVKSTQRRLNLLFGSRAQFMLRQEAPDLVLAEVWLPAWDVVEARR